MNETINKATGEKIKYNRIGGTADNPIYFNDPVPTQTQPLNQTPTAPISATTMTQGTQPLTLPNIKANPIYNEVAQDVGTRTQSQIDIATQEAEALQRAGGNQADQARQALSSEVQKLFTQRGDLAGSQTALEEQAGIADEQKNLREINTEIANTNVALRAEQDRIRNSPMSKGQAQVEIGNIQDTFGRRLADLAIRQSAAQGNITAIQQDVERKIKIALAPIDNKLEYFKTFEKDNVDALTAKEKDKLALIQSSLQDQKRKVEELEKAKGQVVLEVVNNGGGNDKAVLQAIQGATDLSGVYSAGSKYIGALDRELKKAQISKILAEARERDITRGVLTDAQVKAVDNSVQGKRLTALADMKTKQDAYKNLVELYGFEAAGDEKSLIDKAYADLKIAYKEAANLGALTGPDVGLIEEAVKPASGVSNYFTYITSGGKSGLVKTLKDTETKAKASALTNYKNLLLRNPSYANSEYVKTYIDPYAVDIETFTDLTVVPKGEVIRTPEGAYLESLGEGKFTQI